MIQKAIRTTLPDNRVAINNVIDKNTGESIQLVKIPNVPLGFAVDDEVFFETNTVNHGIEYWQRVYPDFGQVFLEKDTMAEMRDLSPVEIVLIRLGRYKGVKLNGYYEKGDTPAPIEYFILPESDSSVDDGGSVIEVGDIKLEHDFVEEVNVKYFGAKGDQVADNTDVIQNAINSSPRKGIIFFPAGVYIITRQINLPNGKELIVEGVGKRSAGGGGLGATNNGISMILYQGTNPEDEAAFKATDSNWEWVFKGINILNNSGRTDIDGVQLNNFRSVIFNSVTIRGFKRNLYIDGDGWYGLLEKTSLLQATEDNFYMEGLPNGMSFRDCRISGAGRYGLYFNDCQSDVHFINCYLENNGINAIHARKSMIINVFGCHLESNGGEWTSDYPEIQHVHIYVGRGDGVPTNSAILNIKSTHFFTNPGIDLVGLSSSTGSINNKSQLIFEGNNIYSTKTPLFGNDIYALKVDGFSRAFVGVFIGNISMSQEPAGRIGDIINPDNLYRYTSIGCELSVETGAGLGESRMSATFDRIRTNRLHLPAVNTGGIGSNSNGSQILAGTVPPEGQINATVSSLYLHTTSGVPIEDRLYIKTSGQDENGWSKYKSTRVKTITTGDADDFEDGSQYMIPAGSSVLNSPTTQDVLIHTFIESDGTTMRSRQIAYARYGVIYVRSGASSSNNRFVDGWTMLARNLSGTTTQRPTIARAIGTTYFDTDLGKPIWWDGANWVDATGTTI